MPSLRHLILALLCFSFVPEARACEPCIAVSSLEKTVENSSVIALVVNNDQDSTTDSQQGPELLQLDIKKVMKGKVDTYAVLVRSWYGGCAYGVQMRRGDKAIVLLQEAIDISTGRWDGTYKLVEDGCSQAQLQVKGDYVWVNDKWIAISSFESRYIYSFW